MQHYQKRHAQDVLPTTMSMRLKDVNMFVSEKQTGSDKVCQLNQLPTSSGVHFCLFFFFLPPPNIRISDFKDDIYVQGFGIIPFLGLNRCLQGCLSLLR